LQVEESIDLFMKSLYEAIILVVVALIGFWEWRSALLMALAIPVTLAMTFGMMKVLGIDLQQVSIATLIIALGLLVDDPVVAGDAIKRDLALGHPSIIAAWLGPTKLATAILYATITNIVAYLPFLILGGSTGEFIYSLPVVLACSLVASRLVSMTFIPLPAYYLLKARPEKPIEERRKSGFAAFYYRAGLWAINHRWRVLACSLVVLLLGGIIMSRLKSQFFPKDLSYLSYVDVWLPEDAPASATNETAARAEQVIRETVAEYERRHAEGGREHPQVLQSLTTFVGGGGPRFWFSVAPELQQQNYAQIIIQVKDKHDTSHLTEPLQEALSARIPGARIDVRQLESGKAVGLPVAIRLTGEDMRTLRDLAEQTKAILDGTGLAERTRDDWGGESFAVRLQTDPDRAVISGLSNIDVAMASYSATYGSKITVAGALVSMRYFYARRRDVAAFLSSVVYIAAMLGGAAFAMHPYLLPATTQPSYGLTIYNSRTGAYSLSVGLVWWLAGVALAVLYFTFLYRSFCGKVRLEESTAIVDSAKKLD
jgi:multidrug efflux pump subunit AcrB